MRNSLHYYQEVSKVVPNVQNFCRYYLVPGLGHCYGGSGGQPDSLFGQLRAWVENGTAPEHTPVTVTLPDDTTQPQILCPYPSKAVLDAGCVNGTITTSCWSCSSSLGSDITNPTAL